MGIKLSRSTIQYFKHNDMDDLEAVLASIAEDDIKRQRKVIEQRRFIVIEGLYRNTGELCPLPEIIALKKRYCYRVIMDESLSFGTMGKTGRGVTEHYNVNISDVEIITVAMDTALGSVGGLCVGSREIVDHQRLSGAGYCFSASAPPFLSAVAIQSLSLLENQPHVLKDLVNNTKLLYKGLSTIKGVKIVSEEETPVMHLVFDPPLSSWDLEAYGVLEISKQCIKKGVGITTSKFSLAEDPLAGTKKDPNEEAPPVRPSLRVCSNATLTVKEINHAMGELKKVIAAEMTKLKRLN